jgi:hypothetical protein
MTFKTRLLLIIKVTKMKGNSRPHARNWLNEKKSTIGGQGLFTSKSISKDSFVAFLTGIWGLERNIECIFDEHARKKKKHIALSYVATWDTISVPPSRRSRQDKTDALCVVSRTQHNSIRSPLRRTGAQIVDVAALMNSKPTHLSNCYAESVVLDGRTVQGGRNGEKYPAIILRARKNIRANSELTWPYYVQGMDVEDPLNFVETMEGEAISSASVYNLWKSSMQRSDRIPRESCGPRIRWTSNQKWTLVDNPITLNPIDAFDPMPAVWRCSPNDGIKECRENCGRRYSGKGQKMQFRYCLSGSNAFKP